MAIKLALLDGEPERFHGTVITAYTIIATVNGRDRTVDHPTTKAEADRKLREWKAANPGVTFRVI